MKTIGFSGTFKDIDRLVEIKESMAPDECLEIQIPQKTVPSYPSLENNVYQTFVFAAHLLQRESWAHRKFTVEIKYV